MVGDEIFRFSHNPQQTFNPRNIQPVTGKEKDCLQYLSGYVLHKFIKKSKKRCNSTENQKLVSILQHFI